MEIFVSELPKSCRECQCLSVFDWCNCLKDCISSEIKDNKIPAICPLKPLSDRLAEERKKVVQELKSWCDKNFNWVGDGTGCDGQEYNEMIGSNNTINKLRAILDQIERNGNDNK